MLEATLSVHASAEVVVLVLLVQGYGAKWLIKRIFPVPKRS